jgi:hypothetical protein
MLTTPPRQATSVAVDADGQAYIAGTVVSSDFPVTSDAFQNRNNETIYQPADYYSGNAFITQLNADGSGLVYSSYLGGSGNSDGSGGEVALAIALDASANAYITGHTVSHDFPVTAGAYQVVNKAYSGEDPDSTNAFITKFGIGLVATLPASTTVITSDANPQYIGVGVTFAATVTSALGTPGGTVGFRVDGISHGSVPLNSSGLAIFATSSLSAGLHTITAAYSGDTFHLPSTGGFTETIIGTAQLTFRTSPAGLTYSLDNTTYTSQQTLTLATESTHTLSVNSLQTLGGVQNTFSSWSDGGAQNHIITATASATYTATFSTAYMLTTSASPATGGSVSPTAGFYPAGTVVNLTSNANSGYSFNGWTGNVANANSATTTITMSAPESAIASFAVSGSTYLFGNITAKSGPSGARAWAIQVSNSGPAAAFGAQVTGIALAQTGGAAYNPAISSVLPALAGNLAPGVSATLPVTIDFSSCPANAKFTANVALSANGAALTTLSYVSTNSSNPSEERRNK